MHPIHKPSGIRLYLFFIVLSMLASALVVINGAVHAGGLSSANAMSPDVDDYPLACAADDNILALYWIIAPVSLDGGVSDNPLETSCLHHSYTG